MCCFSPFHTASDGMRFIVKRHGIGRLDQGLHQNVARPNSLFRSNWRGVLLKHFWKLLRRRSINHKPEAVQVPRCLTYSCSVQSSAMHHKKTFRAVLNQAQPLQFTGNHTDDNLMPIWIVKHLKKHTTFINRLKKAHKISERHILRSKFFETSRSLRRTSCTRTITAPLTKIQHGEEGEVECKEKEINFSTPDLSSDVYHATPNIPINPATNTKKEARW